MSVQKNIMAGIEEAIEYEKGNANLRRHKIIVQPVRKFQAEEIKGIRSGLNMTQVLFALFMGVSVKTVEAWEAGRNSPDGPAGRILSMVQLDPTIPERFNIVTR